MLSVRELLIEGRFKEPSMSMFERDPEPATFCLVDDHLHQAAKIMSDNDCDVVPVLDADGHRIGVITARDICITAYRQCKALWHVDVGSALPNHKRSGAVKSALPRCP